MVSPDEHLEVFGTEYLELRQELTEHLSEDQADEHILVAMRLALAMSALYSEGGTEAAILWRIIQLMDEREALASMTFYKSLTAFKDSEQALARSVPPDVLVRYADFFEKFQQHFITCCEAETE